MRIVALIVVLLMGHSSMALAQEMRCDIAQKFACTASGGCQENVIKVWNTVDFDAQEFSRCDQNGCDTYTMSITPSGEFTIIDVPGHGMFAKMTADGSDYVEAISVLTGVLVSFGQCHSM